MHFSKNALEELQNEYSTVSEKYRKLMIACHIREYRNSKAQEYAIHGFSRRLKSLVRCIDNIYRILPPDRVDLPSSEELSDANINLQAFVFNVSGSIDNLAWIWIAEKTSKETTGRQSPMGGLD